MALLKRGLVTALKVILCPVQKVEFAVFAETTSGAPLFTIIDMILELAVVVLKQLAFEVTDT